MGTGLLSAVIGVAGLVFALILFLWIRSRPSGTDSMKEISEVIHHGAMVFLRREYSILLVFIIIVFALLAWRKPMAPRRTRRPTMARAKMVISRFALALRFISRTGRRFMRTMISKNQRVEWRVPLQ